MIVTIATLCLLLTSESGAETRVEFDTQIMPIFAVAGCNAASCHGAATGQAGFRLSLFGGDPEHDYQALVRQHEGRRVNVHDPDESLVLLKATGQMEHGGEQPLTSDSEAAQRLRDWIAQGATRQPASSLVRLSVEPESLTVSSPREIEPLHVTAHFADGTSRDVSNWSTYWTSDESALSRDADGGYHLTRPGRHWIYVRFLTQVVAVPVTAPLLTDPLDEHRMARHNWIDDSINATLAELRIEPAALADDATFLRRVYLDLTGRLPRPDQVTAFLDDTSLEKRRILIDRLLDSDEATAYWTYRLAKWLRFRVPAGDLVAGDAFYQWLHHQVARDHGWNKIAHELLLSEGDSRQNGPANFHRLVSDARLQAEYFSEVMLGVRLRCANCHNHPLDQWTQDDYHGLAQVFAPIQRGQIVARDDRAFVIHPRTEQPAVASLPGEPAEAESTVSLETLSAWLLDDDNPYFAQAMVGRVWRSLMGRGLIDPVDDARPTNPPSDSRLLAQLTQRFVANDYRLRYLIGEICKSAAYQRSSEPSSADANSRRFFAGATRRPLSAEVLADAIADVTGVQSPGTDAQRTIDLIAPKPETAEMLAVLGRCELSTGCLGETDEATRGVAARLHLLNGTILNARISSDKGILAELQSQGLDNAALVHALYLRALGRPPSDAERNHWLQDFAAAENAAERQQRIEDFLWSLLNCQDFVTNH